MNRVYRIVFSAGRLVVASEHAKGRRKPARFAVLAALSLFAWMPQAYAALAISPPSNDTAIGNDSSAIGYGNVAIDGSANGDDNINIGGEIPYTSSSLNEDDISGQPEAQYTGGTSGSGSPQSGGDVGSATAYGTGSAAYYNDGSFSGSPDGGSSFGADALTNNGGTAIGFETRAGDGTTNSTDPSVDNVAIGGDIEQANDAVAIGQESSVGSLSSSTPSSGGVAVGYRAHASSDPGTAVGTNADASGSDSTAVGYNSTASGANSTALGTGATASQADSVALGSGSTSNTAATGTSGATIRGTSYSFAGTNPVGSVSVGSSGANGGTAETRTITNVAAGQISATSTDAVNGSELYATNQAIDNLQATQSSTGVLHYTTSSGATSSTPTSTASAGNSTTGTVTISNVGPGAVAAGSTQAINGNELYNAEQGVPVHYLNSSGQQVETPTDSAELGTGSGSVTLHHVADGAVTATSQQAVNGSQLYAAEGQAQQDANQAQANAEGYASGVAASDANQAQANAEGYASGVAASDANRAQANAEGVAASDANQALQSANQHSNSLFSLTCHRLGNGSGDIICGTNSSVAGQDAQAEGTDSTANGNGATAYGAGSTAVGNDAVALGPDAVANGYSTTAVGDHAQALAPNSTAVGQDAQANAEGSVALGYGSVANRANSVSVGNAATGLTRQITNVAPGTQGTDAVNLNQLNDALKGVGNSAQAEADKVGSVDASLAGAAAEAAAGKHKNTIAGATSEYNGQASFAFAYQHRFGTHWAAMISVGSNGQASNTAVMGAGSYSW
ncbi:ESPR-type extended signal peptide-containing protein [Acidithiobacillus montserratensis]|uniref:ESPR-type extended signal peptide-containing protein n=1 Tax=Acidithiobacillus montserratensis TaxID=2729135 RepID=A0ACD5HJJ1_9PROT|nr:ESPR-type extended signal peptide-containing protein [Acidithiobacillus montserratensis]MBU2747840.1 hypothetical protein [Acidithiobacillus montserratensis]